MSRKVLLSSLLSLCLSPLSALDLQEAVLETLENNPVVVESLAKYNSAKQELAIQDSGYYPTLDLKAGIGYQDISNNVTNFEKKSDDIYETSLVFNQNLFNGLSTTYSVSTQEAAVMSAAYGFIQNANNTAFNTVRAYLDVLREKELQAIAVQNIQINNKIFNKVQALYDTGMTTRSEKEKIESSLSLARSNFFVSKNNFRNAQYSLKKTLGRYVLAEDLASADFETKIPQERESSLRFSIQNNPSIRVADYDVIAAQESYKEKKSRYLPSIDAQVRQAFNSNLNGIEGDEDDFRAMLVLTYNLFNGGSDKATIQKNQTLIIEKMASRNELKRQITQEFDFSWTGIQEYQSQLRHLYEYKEHSVKTLMLYTDEYDMGRRSLLDLLASQNDLISAKKQIVDAKYKLLLEKYRILNIMGILVPTLVGNEEELLAKVNLEPQHKKAIDETLMSKEGDYLVKNRKKCESIVSPTMARLYGCENAAQHLRRFSDFVFECQSGKLEKASLQRLNSVIEALKKSADSNKFITIVSHVNDSGDKSEDIKRTQKQNSFVKEKMLSQGLDAQKIKTLARGSSERLWIDESTGMSAQNCRTDIIVSDEHIDEASVTEILEDTPVQQ